MQSSKSIFNESLEEILAEVSESKNIHIKIVGGILRDNGINNVKNINDMTAVLREKSINVLKG